MTKLLEEAVDAVRRLPPGAQDAVAKLLLGLTAPQDPEPFDPEHLAAIEEGLAEADRGEFASEDEVNAVLRLFDR